MNERQQAIVRAILKCLYDMDGQVVATVLHASCNLLIRPNALLSEFEEGLRFCENNHWLIGVRGKLNSVKWSITDEGKAAHLEMQ